MLFCFNWLSVMSASLGLFLHPLISLINDYCTVREVASLVVLVSSLMARVYTAND